MLKQIAVQCETVKFAESFATSTRELAGKCDRTAKIIDRIVGGASPKAGTLPKLVNNMLILKKQSNEYKSIAEASFAVKVSGPAAKQQRKK